MSQDTQSATRTARSAWRKLRGLFSSGRGSVVAVASVGLAGMIVGAALAGHGGRHGNPPAGKSAGVLNALRFGNPPKDLLVVFAVDVDGIVQPYYYQTTGQVAPWEDIQNPLADFTLGVEIGNPKVCWTTTGGDPKCVVY